MEQIKILLVDDEEHIRLLFKEEARGGGVFYGSCLKRF